MVRLKQNDDKILVEKLTSTEKRCPCFLIKHCILKCNSKCPLHPSKLTERVTEREAYKIIKENV